MPKFPFIYFLLTLSPTTVCLSLRLFSFLNFLRRKAQKSADYRVHKDGRHVCVRVCEMSQGQQAAGVYIRGINTLRGECVCRWWYSTTEPPTKAPSAWFGFVVISKHAEGQTDRRECCIVKGRAATRTRWPWSGIWLSRRQWIEFVFLLFVIILRKHDKVCLVKSISAFLD